MHLQRWFTALIFALLGSKNRNKKQKINYEIKKSNANQEKMNKKINQKKVKNGDENS